MKKISQILPNIAYFAPKQQSILGKEDIEKVCEFGAKYATLGKICDVETLKIHN